MFRLLLLALITFSPSVFSDVDFFEMKKSALLSAASYQSTKQIEDRLSHVDYALLRHNVLPDSELSYFLAKAPSGLQYLSFRGTSNLENALVDLDLALVLDSHLNIQVHQGFAGAAKAAYNDLKPLLNKDKPIRTTGHSLGGAIAVLMAMYLERDGYQVEQVITFGQPKVTNVSGANAFADLPLIRVVTPKDIVPLVPPLSPLQLQNLDIYWHMGREVILLADKTYAITEGVKSMMRATKFVSSVPDETNLHAHQMATYIALIDGKLDDAVEVPHKMEINLFGFSLD